MLETTTRKKRKETRSMGMFFFLMCDSLVLSILFHHILIAAAYTLTPSQSIADGQTLISQNGTFVLGFFSPTNSNTTRYVGIWYTRVHVQTVVWVANRDTPLTNTLGVLKIGSSGKIVVLNQTEGVVWSSNSSRSVEDPIIEFLDSGNLVLRDARDGNSENYLWQSFDHPGNTLLPGMKLGWDLRTGLDRYLSAWTNSNDPSPGGFTYGMDYGGYLESLMINGSRKFYRNGPWNGVSNSGAPDLRPNSVFTYQLIGNADEKYFIYHLVNQSVIMRIVLTQTSTEGSLQIFTWVDRNTNWGLLVSVPRDRCDDYGLCGPYSTCDSANVVVCQCLQGFKPKSPVDWSRTDWSQGCEREVSVNCTAGEGFRKYSGIKLPDTTLGIRVNTSMNLEECRVNCLRNCSCMGYSNSDVRNGGTGCMMWNSELIDIRQLSESGQDLYIRMAASELDSEANSGTNKRVIIIASIASVAGVILLGLGSWYLWRMRSRKGGKESDDLESPLYDFLAISRATKNFSEASKLGEGGFGPVYKGKLEDNQEIAVKRLGKDSMQGVDEFKNEIILISKLQHRNLVKLLGCCIQGEEKMLIYEYMPNNSLDLTLFDETKRTLLDWAKRFDIILGISRGLLYLHHDSRLRIIHRDLKASNILLDGDMVPKISDFGMARIFGGDQIEAQTKRVVGTYGYMSPEYAFDGHFSIKSDVFSFGVLVLEIISGKKNRGFSHPDNEVNLLGHAWRLWNNGKSMELLDESIRKTAYVEEVERCVHIGLLCVQKSTELRPTMSTVVLMLSTETAVLPSPQLPGFYADRSIPTTECSSSGDKSFYHSNDGSVTLLIPR